jgi:hypothetical protein
MILEALNNGDRISQETARERFNCWRLSGRIKDLRKAGINVITDMVKSPSGARFAEYYIPRQLTQAELF